MTTARDLERAALAGEAMEEHCRAHPDSPSAQRRPQLLIRGDLWVALLGPSVEEGVVGIGPTIPAAFRAFDVQYQIATKMGVQQKSAPSRDRRIGELG
jgi:hypothetical protein